MTVNSVTRIVEKKQECIGKHEVTFDDLLSSAGELGWYQWRLFFATCPFFAFGVFTYLSQIFLTEVSPNHWCNLPELSNLTDFERRDLGIPKDENSRFGYSQCNMYVANWTEVLLTGHRPNDSWKTVPCQYGWEFNTSEIPYNTIGRDLEWVCDRESYQATAQAIFFIGAIIGELIFGWIADRYGRLPAIISSCLVSCVGGFASTFAENFIEFTSARFVTGVGFDSCLIIAYLLLLEYIGPKYRTLLGNLTFALFFCLFMTILPWIALICGDWKILSLVTSLPLALAIFTKYILPESPIWLLSKRKLDEAIEKVLVISRINKKEIPKDLIDRFRLHINNAEKHEDKNQNWSEIFRRPLVRKMFILIGIEYMCTSILYDGLVRTIGQLDFNFFVSFSLMSFTEFPSVILVAFLMDYTGRRWLLVVVMAISSVFIFLIPFTNGKLSVIFAVIARSAINIGYSVGQQWAPEMLPTSVRVSGVALIHILSFVSIFLSPYVVYLKIYYNWLPFVVLGSISAVAVLLPFGLPETAMKALPNTFNDAEELTRNQVLWTIPFLQSKKEIKQANETSEGIILATL